MRNMNSRLTKLECNVTRIAPVWYPTTHPVFLALPETEQQSVASIFSKLAESDSRDIAAAVQCLTDIELNGLERFLIAVGEVDPTIS